MYRIVTQIFLSSIICTCLHATGPIPSVAAPAAAEAASGAPVANSDEALPIFTDHAVPQTLLDAEFRAARRAQMLAGCRVTPLNEIEDPEALAFEKNSDSLPASVDGLMPEAAESLDMFRELVTSFGGTFDLKSAYRPPAYQAHLHDVWVKWKQLRGNRTAGCQALREEVGAEFRRHQLLVRQQPVPESDHARGLAFDAAVAMPRGAILNRKRLTVDRLAALAGIRRPNSRRDPVHFTLVLQHPAVGN